MKRILFLAYASVLWMSSALADNNITIGNAGVVTLPKGGQGTASIVFAFDQTYHGFQLTLDLANTSNKVNGILESGKPTATLGFTGTDHTISSSIVDAELNFLCVSFTNTEMPTSGTLINIPLTVSDDVTVGDTYTVKLKGMEFGRMGETPYRPDDISFTIQIGEPTTSVILNETSTTAPTSSGEAVNVTVNRTIKADTWSTICLPFDMTAAQVKEAFGDDVKLADFDSWSFTGNANSVENITMNFATATTITANTPCLIKVSSNISSFEVKNVEIAPVELPEVGQSHKVGKTNYNCSMYGYYSAGTVEEGEVFLSGNVFYVSTGLTQMKAFRATFLFQNITLPTNANARVSMFFDDDESVTGLEAVPATQRVEDGKVYSLSGQYLGSADAVTLSKGIYVVNNKKVVVKE